MPATTRGMEEQQLQKLMEVIASLKTKKAILLIGGMLTCRTPMTHIEIQL